MLSQSKVFSFIDNENGFIFYFFEGQKLIHDMAVIHELKGEGFHFLRDAILGSQLLSVFLKPKENFGFYIDSDEPYFRYKIETNYLGYLRTLLLPEDFNKFPEKISRVYRISKIIEGGNEPYNTVIKIENKTLQEVINQLFKESFQINGSIKISRESDQSVFLMRLPDTKVDKIDGVQERLTLKDYWDKHNSFIQETFSKGLNEQTAIEKCFADQGFTFLGSKEVQFKCSCSRERMVMGVAGLLKSTSKEELFQGKPSLETKCDYCKTFYEITSSEVEELIKNL